MVRTSENLTGVSGVYSAIHRDTGACYVGSSVNIGKRVGAHLSAMRRGSRVAFHRALLLYGPESFDFEVLERCERPKLLDRERFYIAFLNAASVDGFNTLATPTATYGKQISETTRERLRISHLGQRRKHSMETRAKMSLASKGKKKSPEHVAKLRGQKRSAAWCLRLSLANKGRKLSEAQLQKMRGNRPNAESRAKMSASKKGKKHSPEHIANRAAARRGVKPTPEALANVRAGQQRRREREKKERLAPSGTPVMLV